MSCGCCLSLAFLACAAPAWAQDSKALQALLALPGFEIPFTFDANGVGGLLVADRREALVSKGAARTVLETMDLLAMDTDQERRKALAEGALPRAATDAERVLLLTAAGRSPEAEPLVKGLGTDGLPALRATVEFYSARIDAVLEGALGPLAVDLRTQPTSIIAARPLLGADTQLLLRLLEGSRDALQTCRQTLESGRAEHARDVAWFRVWLACRQTSAYHRLLLGLLSAPQSNAPGEAKTELTALSREAFAYAQSTGDAEAICTVVMGGLASDASSSDLQSELKGMSEGLAKATVRQRVAASLIEGAIRYAALDDAAGARKALAIAWGLSSNLPEVRASVAGPLALLTLSTGTGEEAAAFAREARTQLGALLAAKIEVQALFAKGDFSGAGKALESVEDPASEPWKAVALSVVAAKRAQTRAEWKRLSDAFTVQFAALYGGEDAELKLDALFHSAVLAALGGEFERARSAVLLLLELEPDSERMAALRKAVGG